MMADDKKADDKRADDKRAETREEREKEVLFRGADEAVSETPADDTGELAENPGNIAVREDITPGNLANAVQPGSVKSAAPTSLTTGFSETGASVDHSASLGDRVTTAPETTGRIAGVNSDTGRETRPSVITDHVEPAERPQTAPDDPKKPVSDPKTREDAKRVVSDKDTSDKDSSERE